MTDCQECDTLREQLRLAEQSISLMAPTFPHEIVKLRCQLLEIRNTLDRFTQGRYSVLADGLAASRLIGAYHAIKAGQLPVDKDREAVLTLLIAVGVIDLG
jgi:hypothetical protein